MAIFGYELKKKSATVTNTLAPDFIPLSFVNDYLSDAINSNDLKYLQYYLSVPELQAIVNYRARCFAGMKVKARRIDSGEEIDNNEVIKLLDRPNPLQVFDEFAKQYLISKDIFGNSFIYTLYGASRKNTVALYNLPAMNAEIVPVRSNINPFEQKDISDIIKEYKFTFRGGTLQYEPDDIIHYYDNLIFDNQRADSQWLKGKSKIMPLTQTLENIKTSYKARGILTGNSPIGILSNRSKDDHGTAPMEPRDKEELQNDLRQKYGLSEKKWQYLITSASIDFVSMAVNIGNLKLFEEVDNDQSAVADAFGFSVELFQNNVTYENKKEAKKQLYQDSIIPEAEEWLSGLSRALFLTDQNIELFADYSHIPALQDDYEKRSRIWNYSTTSIEKLVKSGLIDRDEARQILIKIGMI